jgi:hypothetical protein
MMNRFEVLSTLFLAVSRNAAVLAFLCVTLVSQVLCAEQAGLRFGDASGSHGETVEVQVFGSFDVPISGVGIPFTFDSDRLEFVTHDIRDTLTEGIEPGVVSSVVPESGKGFFQFISFEHNTLDPGADVLLARLRFRVLLDAPLGNADVAPVPVGPTFGMGPPAVAGFSFDRGNQILEVEEFVSGAVDVLDCGCPLTVGDLTCEQFLDRILLSFTPSEAYDEIEIRKTDGAGTDEVIAVLEGNSSSFTDPLDTPVVPETIVYSVTARRAGVSSVNATCELVTRRAAPDPVSDFVCTAGLLTWTNPDDEYDLLLLYKNGDLVAELPGETVSHVDVDFSDELAIYTLIGQLSGYRSAEINCLENAVTIFEVGDVRVPLDATRVRVPVYVTNSVVAVAMGLGLAVDQNRLRLVEDSELSLRESEAPTPSGVFLGISTPLGIPSAGILYEVIRSASGDGNLQPGLRQRVFDFVFDVTGEFTEGETIPLMLGTGNDRTTVNNLTLENNSTLQADLRIDGRLTFGSTGIEGVENLQTVVQRDTTKGLPADAPRNVSLSWENGDAYDTIIVERNGELLAELDGSATEFDDKDVEAGFFTYKVIGTRNTRSAFPVSSTVVTVAPPGSFTRGDVDKTGTRDLTDVIAIFRFLFLGDVVITCQDSADVDDSGFVDLTDTIVLVEYLFLGSAIIPPPGTSTPWLDPTPDSLGCAD